nr:exodeoxyribonuclease V subunit gamma [Kofleriaceae bacterium]
MHGNRVESLLDALLAALPAVDPFAPATIVVGSRLVGRWLTREIAIARGIASGLDFVTFDRFVERTWARDGVTSIDRSQLVAALASALADDALVVRLPVVASYLAEAGERGDRAAPRRVQLAQRLGDLCWEYAATRPDWMPALVAGRVPSELAGDADARWQVPLIAEALGRFGGATGEDELRAGPTPLLPWLRRRAGLPAPRLAPVAVFGVTMATRAQLEALTDLAQATDVTVYVLDPCRELWDDVASRGGAATQIVTDPLPLVLWGRPVRDLMAGLVERTGGDVDDSFAEPAGDTPWQRLLADVLARAAAPTPGGSAESPDLRVLACPNVRREVEVVADLVRARLDGDPTLRAHDIAIWIAGNAERHLAQAPAALEAVGVPCHLVDAPLDDRGRISEAVLALLELPTSAMRRRDLLRVMTHPAVLAAYPHVDADDWVRWTERLGIAHGADADAHRGTYLAEFRGRFHWDQGVRRLALGAFLAGGDGVPPVRIAGAEVAPEEVRPDQQASAATYALLVRSLCADGDWLAAHVATLTEWAAIFAGLVDAYIAAPARGDGGRAARASDDARRDIERVRAMLAGLAHVDVDGREVGFREARAHAASRLATARADRGEPLAAGVMIAPLRALRAVPFRVAFVVGLDEGAFPAGDRPTPLDLRRTARAGDVSARDRDRAAFLDVMLSTREALHLSYVAVEAKSGSPLGPSSVVLELADALAPYLGAPSSKDALATITTRFPLHRHSALAGDSSSGGVRPAVARERWAAGVREQLRAYLVARGEPVPDEDGLLALLAHPAQASLRAALGLVEPPEPAVASARGAQARPVSVTTLRGFLEAPVQAWASSVLGIDEVPDDDAREHSDEPFHVDKPTRTVLLRDVFAAWLARGGDDPAPTYDAIVRERELRGQHPVGVFGEAARANDLAALAAWRRQLAERAPELVATEVAREPGLRLVRDGDERPAAAGLTLTRVAFGRASSAGAELRPPLEIALSGGRTIRLVGQTEVLAREPGREPRLSLIGVVGKPDKKTHYHLRGALDHLVLAAAGLAPAGHAHVILGTETGPFRVEHAAWKPTAARAYLAALASELLDDFHGYLLPFNELVRVLYNGRTTQDDRMLGFGPIARRDGLVAPEPDAMVEIARRRFAPLVEHMSGEHGFQRGSRS